MFFNGYAVYCILEYTFVLCYYKYLIAVSTVRLETSKYRTRSSKSS